MYQEELNSSKLGKFLSEFDYVFVDTCSLMEDTFPLFMDRLISSKEYWKEGLEVIVLGECIEELKKHSKEKKKEKANSRVAAIRALKIIRHDKWHQKILTITKVDSDSFADNAIFTKVSSLRIHNKILVITQDKTLTTDLLKLNRLDSQKGRYLSVYRINQSSDLEKNPGEVPNKNSNKKHDASSFQKEEKDNKKSQTLTKAQATILQEDDKLVKNLNNPNYKDKNKLADIDLQLNRLSSIAPNFLKEISPKLSKEDLLKKKNELTQKPKKEEKKETPVVKKDNEPVIFGSGKTASEALKRLALNYHSIVRDPSVSYFEAVHGELDLTNDDLVNVDVLTAKKPELSYKKGKKVYLFSKVGNLINVALKKEQPKKENKPSTVKEEPKAKTQPKPTPKKELPKMDESLSKKKVKIVKVKGSTSGGSSSAIPEGILLVVGEAKKKPASLKKDNKVAVIKKEIKKTSLNDALLADKVLNANINNPNYPKEKALEDIKKQKERLKDISKADLEKFNLKLNDLLKAEKKLK